MDKETLQQAYEECIKQIGECLVDLDAAIKTQNEYIAITEPKSYGSNEAQREAFLAITFPSVDRLKRALKTLQIEREYYRDMTTLCASGLK